MQKNMAQIIVYGLAEQQFLENFELNRRVISRIVENWDQKIYVVPSQALNVKRSITYPPKCLM